MKAVIEPGNVSGTIAIPPSKSMTQRVYAAALLHKGNTTIHNAGTSDDENAALQVIRQLGAKITTHPGGDVLITGSGVDPISACIPCGESGLAARLFAPIAALSNKPIQIEGNGTLLMRPMDEVGEALAGLNVTLRDFDGFLPFTVHGPLNPGHIRVNAGAGSQLLSGILFAISGSAREPVVIEVADLKSKPYIDLTLRVLEHFGKRVTHENYKRFSFDPATFTHNENVEITVEGDWSSAAYFLVAGAVAGDITVTGLQPDSLQADKAIVGILENAGANVSRGAKSVTVNRGTLRAFDFDATHCPDLFPVLSVLASCCDGESSVRGVHRLFHKESNRVESITQMLHDFAVPYSVEDDTLFVAGVQRLQGTVIDSYHDHRIVMAAAIGALRASGPVDISFAESVSKSYTGFFKDLILCGGNCTFSNNK